jgi:predicted amidohydrolase YtcJ
MGANDLPRRELLKGAIAASVGASVAATVEAQTPERSPVVRSADIILKNGKIITIDSSSTIANAIAIAGDRIVAVGAEAIVQTHIAPGTRIVDLKGKTVIPGLIDGHAHMDREGLKGVYPSLAGARSIRDVQERIAELARKAKPGQWIVTMPIGDPPYYWDVPQNLAEKRWPTRQELDVAAPNNPVFIRSIWGFWRHTLPLVSCANTEALKRAGITRDTVSPVETVKLEKDANGDPTGVIIEFDYQPLAELTWFLQAGGFTRANRAQGLPLAAQAYHAYGTTSVFEEHGVANELLRAYKDAYRDGTLTMRTVLTFSPNWNAVAGVPLGPFMEAWAGWLGEPGLGDDWLRVGGLAFGIGHALSDELRASAAPYTGWAGFNYDASLQREQAKEVMLHCARNDVRVVALANVSPGLLDLYDEVDREIPLKGRRWVVGHINSLSPRDIEKIVRMGLVVTSHTNRYIFKEGHLLQERLPPDRHREISPLRDLLNAGVNVGLVTDNVPTSMFWPIWEAVARLDRVTNERVAPEQALTRLEALRCATINNAYLTFDETKKGSLEVGKLADLAVLSADPLTVEDVVIRDISALMTMVGGNVVYEKPNWAE